MSWSSKSASNGTRSFSRTWTPVYTPHLVQSTHISGRSRVHGDVGADSTRGSGWEWRNEYRFNVYVRHRRAA